MRIISVVPVLAAAVVLLSGCASSTAGSAPKPASHQTLDALKSAYTDAGGRCPVWVEDDDIQAAAQSGTCGDGVTLSTYWTAADLVGEVKLLRDTASSGDDPGSAPPKTEVLIGANWLLTGRHVRQLQPKLGGQLVVINPAASS
ncbi:hypothetical protein GCM10025783_05530 [Amnibacterium soli]|uniref:Lipoprotein n=1 Tax=Amnibacterium soli TaxID=1282736 RepID=A0ABP8YUG2_9MICO